MYRKFISENKTERECASSAIKLAEAAGYVKLSDAIAAGKTLKAGDRKLDVTCCFGKLDSACGALALSLVLGDKLSVLNSYYVDKTFILLQFIFFDFLMSYLMTKFYFQGIMCVHSLSLLFII